MQAPSLLQHPTSHGHLDRVLFVALLVSAALHGGTIYAAHRWGDCICNLRQVVCPKICQDPHPRVNMKLVDPRKVPKPPPRPEPQVIVEKPKPDRPRAAPKAGKVVLPDEAFDSEPARPAETKLDRPVIPQEVVVRESDAQAPVIATGEIFGRTHGLSSGSPGLFGLGGTGTAVGAGSFGTEEDGAGTGPVASVAPAAKAPEPEPPPPQPKGPSRPPRVLNWTDPPYPEQARQQGIEGAVVLRLTVGADGKPRNTVVTRSSGHGALDQAAVAHVRRARFSPALRDGKAVAMTITFRVRFRLVNT